MADEQFFPFDARGNLLTWTSSPPPAANLFPATQEEYITAANDYHRETHWRRNRVFSCSLQFIAFRGRVVILEAVLTNERYEMHIEHCAWLLKNADWQRGVVAGEWTYCLANFIYTLMPAEIERGA